MAKEVKRFKKPERSPIQWHEEAQEYVTECGACKTILNSPTLELMAKIRLYHTRSEECLGGY